MAYGKIKADTLVYDNSGSDVEVTLASIGNKAGLDSPTFTGTPLAPTASASTSNTQIATTAFVDSSYAKKAASAGTVAASEVVQVDANKDTTGIRNLTISGNLQVNGTTTTVASSTMTVTDKNIELAKGAANDAAADGGGITLESGDGNKTWNWVDATDAWTSSEHINLGDNKKLLLGTGSDLQVYHSGTHSHIRNGTGELKIEAKSDGQAAVKCVADGAVSLYHSGSLKLATSAAGVTVTGAVTDTKGELRNIPQNNQTSAYTLVATDAGKHIRTNSNVTVPDNIFAIGDAITIFNNSGSDITITQGSNVTMNNAADAATGNRTLASKGLATLLCHYADSSNNDEFVISGAGLS